MCRIEHQETSRKRFTLQNKRPTASKPHTAVMACLSSLASGGFVGHPRAFNEVEMMDGKAFK